jgi:hypothetical protein
MDELERPYHEVANLVPLLTGDVRASAFTEEKTHYIQLSPSTHNGYYYLSVVGLPGGACEYIARPVKIEYLAECLTAMKVKAGAMQWKMEKCKPYATSPDEIKHASEKIDSLVYFIEGADKIKIGVAQHPESRLETLQAGSPVPLRVLAVCRGGYKRERELHSRVCELHSHGEWYFASPELYSYISEVDNDPCD